MKKLIFALVIMSLSGCATNNGASSSSSNVFNLNGKNITLSDELLLELRQKWKTNNNLIITSTLFNKSDVQWSLDYISLTEAINSEECDSLELIQTRKFDANKDFDSTGSNIEPGLFDYVWEVQVCDKQRNYRLVNQKGDPSFTLYPLNL